MVYWMAYAKYHILPGLKVCDAIKQNEPEFANIDFEIWMSNQEEDIPLYAIVLQTFNCLHLWN